MEYAKLLQQSAGRFDYRESPSKTAMKVNEIRNTIDKGGRQSLPRQQTYANKIEQRLTKEDLKRKINTGAFRYKSAVQQEYDDLILSKLRNRNDDEYMKTAKTQSEFMKILGDSNKIEYLSKVDPFGLFMLRQQNEKNKIDFLDQNKQLDDYKQLRTTDPDRAQQMYEFSNNSLLKLFGNQPDIPSLNTGLSVPILSQYNPLPTRLPAPPAPIREPPPAPEPVKVPSYGDVAKTRNRFGGLPIDDEDELDSFSLPTHSEVEPDLDEQEQEIADEVAESIMAENPDISESEASAEAIDDVKEARKEAPLVEASLNPDDFEEQVEEEPLAVELPLKKGKSKRDKIYNEILKSPELEELQQKLAKTRDMGIQEEFANLLADMDSMDYKELTELKSIIHRTNKMIGVVQEQEEIKEKGIIPPSSKKDSKKGSKKEQRKQKRKQKQKQEQEQELELEVAPDVPISSADATRREAIVPSIDPVQEQFDNLAPEIKAQFAKPSPEKLAKLAGLSAKDEAILAKKIAEANMPAHSEAIDEAQSSDDELQQAMEGYLNATSSKEKNKFKSELTKKFNLDKESIQLLEQERRAKEDKDPGEVESAKESVSKIKPLLKAGDKFSKLEQHKLKFYKTDTFPHIATIKEASALSDEQIRQLAEKYRIKVLTSDGQPKAKGILINELYNKNRLSGDGFSGKGFRRLHTYPKHVIAGALHIVRQRKRHLNRNEYNREQAYHLTQKAIHGGGFFGDLKDKIGMWLFKNVHPMGRMIEYVKNK